MCECVNIAVESRTGFRAHDAVDGRLRVCNEAGEARLRCHYEVCFRRFLGD